MQQMKLFSDLYASLRYPAIHMEYYQEIHYSHSEESISFIFVEKFCFSLGSRPYIFPSNH